MRSRVLVVDDDPTVQLVVRRVLERGGFEILVASDGRAALKALFSERVDAVVLDVVMPGLDGWETLERIREVSEVPVLMLTAEDSELAKVRGLRGGADDYVVKPFGLQELVARVEALVRRSAKQSAAPADVYDDGVLTVDHQQRIAHAAGQELALTPTEFSLLAALVGAAGTVLSHDRLVELAWGSGYVEREQVRLYVSRLRSKLGTVIDPPPIQTVRGVGYRYRPPSGSDDAAA